MIDFVRSEQDQSGLLANLREFMAMESAGGILLLATAVLAMVVANSPLAWAFEHGSGDYFSGDKLGIVTGSLISALLAYGVLHLILPRDKS